MPEDREAEENGLGELPSPNDQLENKGDHYPPEIDYFPGRVPADIGSSAPLSNRPQVSVDKTRAASVRSTFDTRPINATDFHHTGNGEVNLSGEEDETVTISYTVPESYVAVLRKFHFVQDVIIVSAQDYVRVSILIDGITQVGHSNIEFLQQIEEQPTHIIAPENSVLAIRVTYPASFATFGNVLVWGHLYGNLLLTKNQPPAFEVGNPEEPVNIPAPPEFGGPRTPIRDPRPVKSPPITKQQYQAAIRQQYIRSMNPTGPIKPSSGRRNWKKGFKRRR